MKARLFDKFGLLIASVDGERTFDLEGVEVDNAGTWARYRER